MNIPEFNPSLFPIDIVERGNLSSEQLRAFITAAAGDMSVLSDLLNEKVLKALNSLVETDEISTLDSGINGTTIYVDPNATAVSDNGIFFHPAVNRPMTIHETFMLFIQVLANMQNGLREGVKINYIDLDAGATLQFDWPYTDMLYDAKVFAHSDNGTASEYNFPVCIDIDNKKIIIRNDTDETQGIFGYIWHPVFNF